jgi:Uma2 family endonuclease
MIQPSRPATVDDLAMVPGKAELVHGEVVAMPPAGPIHGRAGTNIFNSLLEYEERVGGGFAMPDNVGFVVRLPHRESFSPDAAFCRGELPETNEFLHGAPVFAVEIRSADDYGPAAERELAEKRADYFAAGTLVVWDVDLLRQQTVRVFRSTAPDAPTIYGPGDIAEAEPAVPGWSMRVKDIFARTGRRMP